MNGGIAMVRSDLKNWFTYHPPKPGGTQVTRYQRIRESGLKFADEIFLLTCDCTEKEEAIKKIREAVMWANAGIACSEDNKYLSGDNPGQVAMGENGQLKHKGL